MKKPAYFGLTTVMIATMLLPIVPVLAQQSVMTDEHIARIKSNCRTALGTLGRIHANDAPVYINRNQTYFSISDKLMARLNSRLALNRYDAAQLVKTASDYNEALNEFRDNYKRYDDTMAEALRIDCTRQPVSFYDKIAEARDARRMVNDSVRELKALIDRYQNEVREFKTQHADRLNGDGL